MGARELTASAAASSSTLQNLPGEILNHICEFACDPNAIDMSQRLEAWDKTRFPRSLQDKAREPQAEPIDPQEMKRSRDKMRSYKQVMPAELYQDWDSAFGYETPDMRDARLAKQRQTRIERLRACDNMVFVYLKEDNLKLVDTMSVEECRTWILGQTVWRDPDGGRDADPPVAIPEGMFTREALGGWDAERLKSTIKTITGLM